MASRLDLHSVQCPARVKPHLPRRAESRETFCPAFRISVLVSLFCAACGGAVGSGSPPAPATVTVMPSSAQPFTGGDVQFSAVVQNAPSPAVVWQVNQIPGGNQTLGTISTNGKYVAPDFVPNPPTVTVAAALQSDLTRSGSAIVTIQSLSSIQGPLTLSPALSSVTASQSLQLQVLTAGVANTDVTWAIDGIPNGSTGNGTITAGGVYTPPAQAGSHLVTAILKANPAAIGSAQIEVTDFPGTLTWRNDNDRSGVNNRELALAPGTVSSATFGKLFSCPLDGYAYAQPLYVPNLAIPGNGTRNVVFVATEKDSVFAFDADTSPCVQLWATSLIPSGSQAVLAPTQTFASTDIVPFVGITGTPVISLGTSALYAVAKTSTIALSPTYDQRLYALDLATGRPKLQPSGVQIGSFGSPLPAFSSRVENQRAALLLDNSTVYIAFGAHQGETPYHGWLFGHDASTIEETKVFDATPGAIQGGGIWQSGGGPSADSNHNVFLMTGDGTFDVERGGFDYSDSFVRLATDGGLSVSDYFTPCDQATDGSTGQDVGASAPVLLPDSAGSSSQPHLLLGGSKSGSLYVVNRDNMGGFTSACPDSPPRVQIVAVGDGPILSTPLFWNNAVYVAAGNGKLKSLPLTSGALSSSASLSESPETLGPQGSTPVMSSNGTSNAILWLIDTSGALATPNGPAVLRAYDPNNLSDEIYSSAMVPSRDTAGLAVKFTVPTVANGKVYVGTQTELDVYGLLH
jgi:hypothetical protein